MDATLEGRVKGFNAGRDNEFQSLVPSRFRCLVNNRASVSKLDLKDKVFGLFSDLLLARLFSSQLN